MHAIGYVVAGTDSAKARVLMCKCLPFPAYALFSGWVGPVPIFVTFSSVCEQIKDMPVGFALWEQVLGSVYDVLDQALRLFFLAAGAFQSCRRFFYLRLKFLLNAKRLKFWPDGGSRYLIRTYSAKMVIVWCVRI